jgi:hypothetical protein
MVKLLPFASVVFAINGGAAVNPNGLGFVAVTTTARAAKLCGVEGRFGPIGRNWGKSFHKM